VTLTPMLCARWLKAEAHREAGAMKRAGKRLQQRVLAGYARSLDWALAHARLMLCLLLGTIALNVYLYVAVPKTFLPQQDTSLLTGLISGDDGLSLQVMQPKMVQSRRAVRAEPAVESVAGFIGSNCGINNAFMIVRLKPLAERRVDAQS